MSDAPKLEQSDLLGTGPSVKPAEMFLPLKKSPTPPLLPSHQKAVPAAVMKTDPVTVGTKGPWLDSAMQCIDGHMKQILLSTSQAHLFTD